jgi:hypothetical protein
MLISQANTYSVGRPLCTGLGHGITTSRYMMPLSTWGAIMISHLFIIVILLRRIGDRLV